MFDPLTILDDADESILSDTERAYALTLGRLLYEAQLAAIERDNSPAESDAAHEADGRLWGWRHAGMALMPSDHYDAAAQIAQRRVTEMEAELPQLAMARDRQEARRAAVARRNVVYFARTAHGWTQAELAAHLGVGQSAVSQWESGKTPIPDDRRAELERLRRGDE